MSIWDLHPFFKDLAVEDFKKKLGERLIKEVNDRIRFMVDAGLGYLTLSRQTRTLSSGEYQRITLARALGSALTETLYVLDDRASVYTQETRSVSSVSWNSCANGGTPWSSWNTIPI